MMKRVSIPFKRESVSKVIGVTATPERTDEFQFPSNGKAYPKLERTGFRFRSTAQVSIPFKRESVSKAGNIRQRRASPLLFQFPSNGKAYPKPTSSAPPLPPPPPLVSIPFKRESGSKAMPHWNEQRLGKEFQFPSNGKADPKRCRTGTSNGSAKSFNSLQTGKRIQSKSFTNFPLVLRSFNSLQTGKRIQRYNREDVTIFAKEFQFPSNGKAYPKLGEMMYKIGDRIQSFNSLQTGKRIQSV